jgi:hypothetical protein
MKITSHRRAVGAAGIAVCALLAGYVRTPAASASTQPTSTVNARGSHGKAQDPTTFDISQALAAMKRGKITSVQLSEDFLARINEYEPYYNAFTQLNPDAIKEAMASIG